MSKYTIICNQHTIGHLTEIVEKEKVRSECERLRKVFNTRLQDKNTYTRIEVINNETGQIQEYWNNKENTINF